MNTLTKMLATLMAFGVVAMPLTASAQEQSPVTLKGEVMAVETSVDADGKETTKLVEPALIVPGDRLMFGTEYANNGEQPADNFIITNAVPGAVRVAPDAPSDLIVSVDGGKTWGKLADLTVSDEDDASRPARHDDVTHVRWTLASIAPGERGRVEYPAIIR